MIKVGNKTFTKDNIDTTINKPTISKYIVCLKKFNVGGLLNLIDYTTVVPIFLLLLAGDDLCTLCISSQI